MPPPESRQFAVVSRLHPERHSVTARRPKRRKGIEQIVGRVGFHRDLDIRRKGKRAARAVDECGNAFCAEQRRGSAPKIYRVGGGVQFRPPRGEIAFDRRHVAVQHLVGLPRERVKITVGAF